MVARARTQRCLPLTMRSYRLGRITECGFMAGTRSAEVWSAVMRTALTGRTHGCTDQRCDVTF